MRSGVGEWEGGPCGTESENGRQKNRSVAACQNGGLCVPRLADSTCVCSAQYTGERCEQGSQRFAIHFFS